MTKQPCFHWLPAFGELAWQDEQKIHSLFPLVSLSLPRFFLWKTKTTQRIFKLFFISTCLKWDTGWTLVSQNNEICLVGFGWRAGLLRTFWLMIKSKIKKITVSILNSCQYSVQIFVVWCTELAFLPFYFPYFVHSSLLSNSRSRLMCLRIFFFFFTYLFSMLQSAVLKHFVCFPQLNSSYWVWEPLETMHLFVSSVLRTLRFM